MDKKKKKKVIKKHKEAYLFSGKAFAAEKELILKERIAKLSKLGVKPQLNVILTTNDPASVLYVNLKRKAAERLGIEFEVYKATTIARDYQYVLNLLAVLNVDPKVHGIMIQLPLNKRYTLYKDKILNAINPAKDVDGLGERTMYTPATVKAVIEILKESQKKILMINPPHIFVIGSKGAVGSALMKRLPELGYPTRGYDVSVKKDWRGLWGIPPFISTKADIIITATGVPGVLIGKHVNNGAVVIDVGSPQPDAYRDEVIKKAAFLTPVPGGVGPVTIVSLLENLVDAAYNSLNTHLEGTLS